VIHAVGNLPDLEVSVISAFSKLAMDGCGRRLPPSPAHPDRIADKGEHDWGRICLLTELFDRVLHRNNPESRMSAQGQNRRYRTPTWESALTSNSGH
jgi:hypothetical protein